MKGNKTKPEQSSVTDFLESVSDETKKKDAYVILEMMRDITGEEPVMWGESIIGFGTSHYKYNSGREGDWFLTGFSPRKQNMSIYLTYGVEKLEGLNQLGKYKTGKACLYVKRLSDIDSDVLRKLIATSVEKMKALK